MKIRDIELEVDVQDYLERKGLNKVKPAGNNVMSCCPFHSENSPSFGVNVHTGVYNCFGCGAKGSFGHLVKELDKFDTVYDAEEYLIGMFGTYATNADESFELQFDDDDEQQSDYWIPDDVLDKYKFRSSYLGTRGITEKWQRGFEIGFHKGAISIPWRDEKGRLLSVKMRLIAQKKFWYEPAMPPRIKAETLWGLDKVLKGRGRFKRIAITEAEVDCLSVWQVNDLLKEYGEEPIGVIAIGGNQLTDAQAAKLKRLLPTDTEFIAFTDNDSGGDFARELIADKLSDFVLTQVDWKRVSHDVKDANDLATTTIYELLKHRIPLGLKIYF